jgi:DNA helicase-2/ATP-dependent DNA helicase PcrA
MEDALRKRNIPYRVYGGVSFYQRKEIKDVLAYLRLLINPNDEESLKRVINYPMRGIGQTTINKLIVAAKTHDCTLYQVLEKVQELPININAGTRTKLKDFYTLIESIKTQLTTLDAFELADVVTKKVGLVSELKKEGTPEAVTRIENIEELLNGIKDFVEGQRELVDATGSLVEFLEDVALATDFDNEVKDQQAVSLMTIHLAKGLEFPNVYIVGLEEDLFPSAMSINTRAELEEERRLFYVALTRAEKRVTLTYTLSRYRWGKIIDAEPSRFLTEIDEAYIDNQVVQDDYSFKPFMDTSVFDVPDPNKVRFKPPVKKKPAAAVPPKARMKSVSKAAASSGPTLDLSEIQQGIRVSHSRFGFGTVLSTDGVGNDAKALIRFDQSGEKNVLLRFAKLKVVT